MKHASRRSSQAIGLILLLAIATVATAQEESVLQVLQGQPPNDRVEQILYLAAGVELSNAGLSSRRMRESGGPSEEIAIDRVRHELDQSGTPYALIMEYGLRDEEVDIEFSLYARGTEGSIGVRTLTSPIDLDLDARVSSEVHRLIESTRLQRVRTAETRVEGIELGRTTQIVPPASPTEPTVEARDDPYERVSGPELVLGTLGLIVLGESRTRFTAGVAATLAGGYTPSLDAVAMTVGARLSAGRLFTAEASSDPELSVATAGPEVQIGTLYRSPAQLGVRLSGGVAVLVVTGVDETLAKSVPFAEAGLAGTLPIGARLSLGVEVNYLVIFESSFWITGISPAISIGFEP